MPGQAVEINPWEIGLTFPAPVALAYKHYAAVSDRDVARKARALFSVAEVSCRYLVAVTTADYLSKDFDVQAPSTWRERLLRWRGQRATAHPPADPVPQWIEKLPVGVGLEFGKWVGALHETVSALSEHQVFMPEAAVLARRSVFRLLEELLTLRNSFVHPKGAFELSDDEINELMRQAKPKVTLWLAHLRFLANYPLCVAYRTDPFGPAERQRQQGEQEDYIVVRHMGSLDPEERHLRATFDPPLQEHLPFLLAPGGDSVLYLWPFLVAPEPGDEGEPGDLFTFERQLASRFNSVEYVATGHRAAFTWTSHSPQASSTWLRAHRSALPGILRIRTDELTQLRAPEKDKLVGKVLGPTRSYTIVRRIGQGGMGVVYVATDVRARSYAVKVLHHRDPRTLRRFQREIDHMGRLRETPGIVHLLDWGMTEGPDEERVPYYVMEYAERGDLSSFIKKTCVPLDETGDPWQWDLEPRLVILEQVADALACLHKQGIVHRDIKPGNVILMSDDSVRLADFGLSRALTPERDPTRVTGAFSLVGTTDYMAPEQLFGQQELVNASSDVFSFGILMFELLIGRVPRRRSITELAQGAQVLVEQKALQAVPKPLRHVLLRCTDPVQSQRYGDGEAVVTALREALPRIRTAKLVVQTQPPNAVVQLNGEERGRVSTFEITSGVHVVAAVDGDLVAPAQVLRVPPLAKIEIILILETPATLAERTRMAEAVPAGAHLTEKILEDYLAIVDLKLVTRAVGYGTIRQVEDRNSLEIWRMLTKQWGAQPIPLLMVFLKAPDAVVRMKALKFLFHYSVNDPAGVDLRQIHHLLVTEEVRVIKETWTAFLQTQAEANWGLLVEILASKESGDLAAGIPTVLRRLGDRPEVTSALAQALSGITHTPTRVEAARALAARHPLATNVLAAALNTDPDASVRVAAAYALAEGAPSGVFDTLCSVLENDPAPAVRVACARAMIGLNSAQASEAFERLRAVGDPAIAAAIDEAVQYTSK